MVHEYKEVLKFENKITCMSNICQNRKAKYNSKILHDGGLSYNNEAPVTTSVLGGT